MYDRVLIDLFLQTSNLYGVGTMEMKIAMGGSGR